MQDVDQKEIQEIIRSTAKVYNYEIIEGAEERMIPRFLEQKEKYGLMYCPCQAVRNADTLCPCKFMRKYNACRCGLFKQGGK